MAEAQPKLPSDKIKGGAAGRPRSILKRPKEVKKDSSPLQWDEMNIIATLHPKDKDYGHMKIDEPKTPFLQDSGDEDTADMETELCERAKKPGTFLYKEPPPCSVDMESGSDSGDGAQAEKEKKAEFKKKRKLHYNEGAFMKQARELARRSLVEDDDK